MITLFLAAGEGGNPVAVQIMPFVSALLVFAIAFMVLKVKVWPRITAGLDERENKIRDEIKSAEEARAQATAALAEYESSLAQARQAASEMIAKAKGDAKAAADELKRRNDAELADMKMRATKDIATAKAAAITEIHAHAASLAAAMASKILEREISVDDQQRLVEESLAQLQNRN